MAKIMRRILATAMGGVHGQIRLIVQTERQITKHDKAKTHRNKAAICWT
jgi:hypothetical protein